MEFRKEVEIAQSSRMYGVLVVRHPPSMLILAFGTLVIVIALGLLMAFGTYTRRVPAVGLVTTSKGLIRVKPTSAGVIADVLVKEGQHVAKGQQLFLLEDGRSASFAGGRGQGSGTAPGPKISQALLSNLGQRLELLQNERSQKQQAQKDSLQGMDSQHRQLVKEITLAEAAVHLGRKRVEETAKQLQNLDSLSKTGFLSASALQDRRDQLAVLELSSLTAERTLETLRRQADGISYAKLDLVSKANLDRSALDSKKRQLELEQIELNYQNGAAIVAPASGQLTGLVVGPGAYVDRQLLATIVPRAAHMVVNLYVTSKAVGFIKKGQPVQLRFQAFPYQKFGTHKGIVEDVGLANISQDELPDNMPLVAREGLYRVTVKLAAQSIQVHGGRRSLVPGMIVEADIMQEKRALYEWVLQPIFSVRERVFKGE